MKLILAVGIGSFIGGILRFLISDFVQTKSLSSFPYGTLAVNIIGCLVIGIVFALVETRILSTELKLFLGTGLIGGFTTYSAFSYETFILLRNGHIWQATVYVLLSILLGLAATTIGFLLFRNL